MAAAIGTLFAPVKTAAWLESFQERHPLPAPSADSVEFDLAEPLWLDAPRCTEFVINAHHRQGYYLGRVVCDVCTATDSCYVADVVILDERWHGHGIGSALLQAALELSGASELVPVTITRNAVGFWCHLALSGRLPVRLGLRHLEYRAIQHQLVELEEGGRFHRP